MVKNADILVFDMDGVLVDVTRSYRECIRMVVRHFSGREPGHDEIQALKNTGGWNNDWELSHHLIGQAGIEVAFPQVVQYFDQIFLGNDGDGMIRRERWVARPGLLQRLSSRYQLALFTGRSRRELAVTLHRFAGSIPFEPVIAAEDVTHPKPSPEGLQIIASLHPGKEIWYVGDNIDDARSARAAGVFFIGVANADGRLHEELHTQMRAEGAVAVIPDINSLERVLPA